MARSKVFCRTTIGLERRLAIDQQMPEPRAHLVTANESIRESCAFADRHDLEKTRRDAPLPGPMRERLELVVVLAAYHHDVELRALEACVTERFDAGEHLGQNTAARDGFETGRIERVERDGHPMQPRAFERQRQRRELGGVRRQGEIDDRKRRDHPCDFDDLGVEQRLSARDANPPHPRCNQPLDHHAPPVDIEAIFGGEIPVAVIGSAIHTRKITTIGERQSYRSRRGNFSHRELRRDDPRRRACGRWCREDRERAVHRTPTSYSTLPHGHAPSYDRRMNDSPRSVRIVTVTVSDTRTEATDEGGKTLRAELERGGFTLTRHAIVRDEPALIHELIDSVTSTREADAIVLTGGTGIGPRDRTYEAVSSKLDLTIDGFGEAFRRLSWDQIGPRAILSRAIAGVCRGVVIVSLPGSVKAVVLAVQSLITPTLGHAVDLVRGDTAHGPKHEHKSHS